MRFVLCILLSALLLRAISAADNEVRERLIKEETPGILKLDPQRIERRTAQHEMGGKAIAAYNALRRETGKAQADALEEAFEELRKASGDFRDPDKPLELFYESFDTVLVPPRKPGDPKFEPGPSTAADWKEYLEFLGKWSELRPDTVAPHVARARALMRHAWLARGSGLAGTVTDEGWELFRERVAAAAVELEKGLATKQEDPELYRQLIKCLQASGGDREAFDKYLARGSKIGPSYYSLYEVAAEFLLPRWHGGPGEIESAANRYYDELGPDTGKLVFFRMAKITQFYDGQTVLIGKYEPAKLRAAAVQAMALNPMNEDYARFALIVAWATDDHPLAMRCRHFLQGLEWHQSRMFGDLWVRNGVSDFYGAKPLVDAPQPAFRRWIANGVNDFDFSPNVMVVANGDPESPLRLLRGPEYLPSGRIAGDNGRCVKVRFSPGAKQLIYELQDDHSSHFVRLNQADRTQPVLFDAIRDNNVIWAGSPDGRYLAAGSSVKGPFTIYNAETGVVERTFQVGGPRFMKGIAFTRDSKTLVLLGDGHLTLYDPAEGTVKSKVGSEQDFPMRPGCMVGPNSEGKFYLSGHILPKLLERPSNEPQFGWVLWDPVDNATELLFLKARDQSGRLSADGRYLAAQESVNQEHKARVYDLKAKKTLFETPLYSYTRNFAVTPDNRFLVVSDNSGLLRFWELPRDEAEKK